MKIAMAWIYNENHANEKWAISDDFGLRNPVIQKKKKTDEKCYLYRSTRLEEFRTHPKKRF